MTIGNTKIPHKKGDNIMTRKEKKTAIENMAEDFMNLGNKGKTMVMLMQTAYNEGKAAGKQEERAKWERKPA